MSKLDCEIKISDIDLSDQRYQISTSQIKVLFLAQSILETGVINRVVLLPVQDKYIVVCGFNRVKAFIQNKAATIPATLVRSDMSECDCLVLAICEASFKHPLSPVELIKSLTRLSDFMDIDQIVRKSGALFNIQLNQKYVDDLVAIGRLEKQILFLLESGQLSIKAAKKLSTRNALDISLLLMLFGSIKASTSIQLEMILYLHEVCKRDKISLKTLLKDPEIQSILNNENNDFILKTNQLRNIIYKMRFPALFYARQDIKHKINSLGLGNAIKIEPPPNFESRQFKFSFSAQTHQQFVQHFDKLAITMQKLELKDIFNP